jgi:toxin ParE1/3/4
MTNSFLQLSRAKKEIVNAWDWYEDQQIGLGDEFKDEVRKKISAIQENPLHYPVKGKYKEARTDIFPFSIVFRFDQKKKLVIIISVFHTSRNPKKK